MYPYMYPYMRPYMSRTSTCQAARLQLTKLIYTAQLTKLIHTYEQDFYLKKDSPTCRGEERGVGGEGEREDPADVPTQSLQRGKRRQAPKL